MSLSKYNKTTKELEPIAGGFDVEGILENIGDLTELDTTDKSSLVDAINEVNSNKVDKVEGKGLSTNDYSDTEKGKVADNTAAIRAIVNVTGSCNVLQPYLPVSSGGGVTLTLNADGTISCPAVTSTNPDGSFFVTGLWTATTSGSFKFSGCPSGGSSNTYFHYLMEYPSGGGSPRVAAYDYGDGEEITVTSGYMYEAHIVIKTAVTSLLFKPMLYDARLNPSGYVPYAMTNRELTERVSERYVSVVGDGVKTNQQLLNDLYSLIDATKITTNSRMSMVSGGTIKWYHRLAHSTLSKYEFAGLSGIGGSEIYYRNYVVESNLSSCYLRDMILTSGNLQVSDETASVPSNTIEYRLYY